MKLYSWQKDCLKQWESHGCRGIVNAVTGTGKTVLALAAVSRLLESYPDLKIRIVAPTIALANQWRQSALRILDIPGRDIGFYGDGRRDDADARIVIYVVNSARTSLAGHMRRDFALGHHVLLICDECHRYTSSENRKIFSAVSDGISRGGLYSCLGLSATPFSRDRDEILTGALGQEIYRYGFDDARGDDTISPFAICQVAADFRTNELEEYTDVTHQIGLAIRGLHSAHPYLRDLPEAAFFREIRRLAGEPDMDPSDPAARFLLLTYERKRITVNAEARLMCCSDLIDTIGIGKRILIFCERIDQAEAVNRVIHRRYGNISGLYHSGLPRDARKRVLEGFRENNFRVLVSCRCLDEGLDVPDADVGIVMSSSAVPRQRIQRLGRIIRRSDSKAGACLYYIYIRESNDDKSYLAGLDECPSLDLRYYSNERVFANPMYEYAASEILREAARGGAVVTCGAKKIPAMSDKALAELRSCLLEGLTRSDYLLPDKVISEMIRAGETVHQRNYWRVMKRMNQYMSQQK